MLLLGSPRADPVKQNEEDHSSIAVNISYDSAVTMNVLIRRDEDKRALVYNAHVSFVANDRALGMTDLSPNVLSELVRKYRDYTIKATKTTTTSETKVLSSILPQTLTNVKKVKDLVSFGRDLTTINIYTIDTLANKTIARTTIELDADILTVLPQDVLQDTNLALLLNLQNCNTILINQLFRAHIKIFTDILLSMDKVIKLISLVPFTLSLIPFFSTISNGVHTLVLPPAFFAVVSTFLYTYAPRIIFRYMPNILLRVAPRIIGYLVREK